MCISIWILIHLTTSITRLRGHDVEWRYGILLRFGRTTWGWAMRLILCSVLILFAAACQKNDSAARSQAPAGIASREATATDLSGVKITDTIEDPASASAGEALAREAGATVLNKPAPVALLKTIDGDTIDIGQVYGKKPVYLKFWATWCTPCRQQMPAFQSRFEKLGHKIQVVAVNIGLSDDIDSIRAVRKKYGLTMPIVMDDGRLARLFNLKVTPQHVLIGRDARFAYVGHAENKNLDAAIQRVLDQPPSSNPTVQQSIAERTYKIGDVVDGLTVTTTEGAKASLLASGSGRLRGIMFFSSWCEWYLEKSRPSTAKACVRTREAVARLAAKDNGVDWIGIAGGPWSTAQDLADYRSSHNVRIPLALDSSDSLFRAFGIRDIPTIVLIDSNGKIVQTIAADEVNLEAQVKSAKVRG
jgi:peroxiredoxin